MAEWVHPWLLLLLPVPLLLWLWNRNRIPSTVRARIVPSTQIWHLAVAQKAHGMPLRSLLLAMALIVIASGPRLIPTDEGPVAARRITDGSLVIDIQLPGSERCQLQIGTQSARTIQLSAAGEASVHQPPLPAGTPIVVTSSSGRHHCPIPPLASAVLISDRTDLAHVAAALEVLEESGLIIIEDLHPEVLLLRGANASTTLPIISFPADEGSMILPRARPTAAGPVILEGLHPRYWTILRSSEVLGEETTAEPILVDEDANALLIRSEAGYRWGFLPGSGDLWKRSDWPVVLGRMIRDLGAAGPFEATTWLSAISRQSSLILAIAMAICIFAFLGRNGQISASLIIVALIIGQVPEVQPLLDSDADWDRVSATSDPGTTIEVFHSTPPPSPDLVRLLRGRGVGISMAHDSERAGGRREHRLRLGQPFSIGNMSRATARSPEGESMQIELPWIASSPGVWQLDGQGDPAVAMVVIVEEPIRAALWSDSGSMAKHLLPESVFSTVGGSGSLPEPAAGAVIVWNAISIDEAQIEALEDWIGRGGTLLALPTDRFCDDEATRLRLQRVLATEIPPPPEPPVQDLGILLLDLSGSLTGEAASTLLAGTRSLLQATPRQSRWGIAGFRDQMHWIIEPGTPIDESIIDQIPDQISTGGGTDLGGAVRACHRMLVANEGGKSLVVITDGRTTPDDWISIGQSLRRDGIELDIVLVGDQIDLSAVTPLSSEAGGEVHRAPDSGHARALLQEAIRPDDLGWQPVEKPLRIASVDPFIDAGPQAPPVPVRRIAVDLSSRAPDGKILWVDGRGAPMLAVRRLGAGISAIWYSGLDSFSLPGAVNRTHAHLSELLAASADRRKEPRRRGLLTRAAGDEIQLMLERLDSDPLSMEISAGPVGAEGTSLLATARPGQEWYSASIPEHWLLGHPRTIWWGPPSHIDAGVTPVRGSNWRWRAALGGADQLAPAPLSPASGWLLLLASLSLFSNRVRRWSDLLPHRDTEAAAVQRR
ncbi:MAG: vWA domain-containing protein [Planctomycetota bacterium]|nr:vWA domain-containing protein [Planctomycetota bacterium]